MSLPLRERVKRALARRRTWAGLIVFALVSLAAAYALFGLVRDPSGAQPSVTELFARINWQTVVLFSAIYFADLILAVVGWGLIIGRLSGFANWFEHARIYCVTAIGRHIPGSVWYLLGRMLMYESHAVPRALVVVGSGVEFAAIVLGSVVLIGLTWPFALSAYGLDWGWIALAVVGGVALLNPLTLRWLLAKLLPHTGGVVLRLRDIVAWVLLYVATWAVGGLMLVVLVQAIAPLPLAALPAIVGVWAVAGLVSTLLGFLPLGIGQDLTLTALLALSIGPVEALVVALLMRLLVTANTAGWAVAAALLRVGDVVALIARGRAELPERAQARRH